VRNENLDRKTENDDRPVAHLTIPTDPEVFFDVDSELQLHLTPPEEREGHESKDTSSTVYVF
jgi:hypothetical protein